MNELEQRVLKFVAEQTGVKLNRLQLDSTLREDIGMDGDDAVEFFEAFSREFRVTMEELAQTWDSYFLPEGFPPGVLGPDRDISIVRLVEAARSGQWSE